MSNIRPIQNNSSNIRTILSFCTLTNMRKLFIFLGILISASSDAQSQPVNEANAILLKVKNTLGNLAQVSYRQNRETRYYADNYHNLFESTLYFDFTGDGPLHMRFQGDNPKTSFIYNGNATLRINKSEMTIDSATVQSAKNMESNSYLFHSLFMLRNMLSTIIGSDGIHRSLKDTLVGNNAYYKITFEADKAYFQLLGDLEHYDVPGFRRPYHLLVDKKTYLPYQLISSYVRGTDDRDFVTVTYDMINTKPARPAAESWNYTAYSDRYKPYVPPVKIPLVKTGTVLANFTLPDYTPHGTDSVSLKQYSGKVVLVDFWFKSCSPCMAAMPHYNQLQNKYGKEGFQLLTVNVEDPVEDVQYFYNKYKPVYKMLYNGNKLWKGLGFTGCPSAVLLDKKGVVVQVFFGFEEELISKKVEELVKTF